MSALELEKFSMEYIAAYNLPIYVYGTVWEHVDRLLSYFEERHLKHVTVFSEDTAPFTFNYSKIISLCTRMGVNILPPPPEAASMPRGVVICAAELCEQRKWLDFFSKDNIHVVVDAHDLFCYPAYVKCHNYFMDSRNLLLRCRTCRASYRDCPIRERYYENNGVVRKKTISRLLLRCGFICNYNCEGCSQFLPYFTERHKRNFDGAEIINGLRKLAASLQYIGDLWLEGGEAMLWAPLPVLLHEAANFDNLGRIYILTNGSYIPNRMVLDALQQEKDRIHIEVNAYSNNRKLNQLFDEFDKLKINFSLRGEITRWTDFRDTTFRDRSADEFNRIRNECYFYKRDYNMWIFTDGKLSSFCCIAGYLAHYLNIYDQCQNDYIEIKNVSTKALPLAMDDLYDRGDLYACNFCAGGFHSTTSIEVAKQC